MAPTHTTHNGKTSQSIFGGNILGIKIASVLCGIALFGNVAMADESRTCHFPTYESMQGVKGVYQVVEENYENERKWSTSQEELTPFEAKPDESWYEEGQEQRDMMQEALHALTQANLRIETHCNGNYCTSKGYEGDGQLRYEANCLNGSNHGKQRIYALQKYIKGYMVDVPIGEFLLDFDINYAHGKPSGTQRFSIKRRPQYTQDNMEYHYTADFTIQDGKLHGQYHSEDYTNIQATYSSLSKNLTFYHGIAVEDFYLSDSMLIGMRGGNSSTQVGQYNTNGQIQGDLVRFDESRVGTIWFDHISCHENTCHEVAQYGLYDYHSDIMMPTHVCQFWYDEAVQLPIYLGDIGPRYFLQKHSSDFTPKGLSSLLEDFYNATSNTLNTTLLSFYHPKLSYCSFVDTLISEIEFHSIKNVAQAMQILPEVKMLSQLKRFGELYEYTLRPIKRGLFTPTNIGDIYDSLDTIKSKLLNSHTTNDTDNEQW